MVGSVLYCICRWRFEFSAINANLRICRIIFHSDVWQLHSLTLWLFEIGYQNDIINSMEIIHDDYDDWLPYFI